LTLTDSEEGFVMVYGWTESGGFEIKARWDCPCDEKEVGEVVGASVVAWVPGWEKA
jgi:hypothetical protein